MSKPWFVYVDRNNVALNREIADPAKRFPPIAVASFNDDGTMDVRRCHRVKVSGELHHDVEGRFIPEIASVVFVQDHEPEILG